MEELSVSAFRRRGGSPAPGPPCRLSLIQYCPPAAIVRLGGAGVNGALARFPPPQLV